MFIKIEAASSSLLMPKVLPGTDQTLGPGDPNKNEKAKTNTTVLNEQALLREKGNISGVNSDS